MFKLKTTNYAFTLIELLMVVIIITILGIFAIPRIFISLDQSKTAATKAILASTRSSISIYITKQVAESNSSSYPTLEELQTTGVVLDSNILPNPYNDLNAIRDADTDYDESDPPVDMNDTYGWAYDQTNGKFWANTNDNEENKL